MKMEFDSEQIAQYLSLIKALDTELLTYRLVYEYVWDSGLFPLYELVDQMKKAKAAVQPEMDAKYDEALRKLADISDQASALRALEFLARWTPKGRPS